MKKLILFFITAAVFAISCSKDHADPNTLTGKWKYYGSSISIGGPKIFNPAPKGDKNYVQFDGNGKMISTTFPQFVSYNVKDSLIVTFTKANNEIQNYIYVIKDNILHLSPAGPGPVCIEGCSTSFIKVKY